MMNATVLAALCAVGAAQTAQAAMMSQTVSFSGSGTTSPWITQLGTYTFMSHAFEFDKFDASLGNLTSAHLVWDFDGETTVTVEPFAPTPWATGWVIFGFAGQFMSAFYDVEPTGTYQLIGPDGDKNLNLADVNGSGMFAAGTFDAALKTKEGLWPLTATGSFDGTVTLTYTYDAGRDTAAVPEPASLALLGVGLAAVALGRRGVRR